MKNSLCQANLFHDYQITKSFESGVVEMCSRCKHRVYFPNTVPNHIYLSFHLRSMLQPSDPRYKREYAPNTTSSN